jgi:hypothetical protein
LSQTEKLKKLIRFVFLMEKKKNGGARPGAGRKPKPKTEAQESAIAVAEKRCADRLPLTLANLEEIADGRAEQTEVEEMAAGTITIGKGAYVKPAFPDLPPEQMVLVRRKTVTFAPEARANMYLADRVMGKPSDGDEAKIRTAVEAALDSIFTTLKQTLSAGDFEKISAAFANSGNSSG